MSAPYADKILVLDGDGTIKEQGTYDVRSTEAFYFYFFIFFMYPGAKRSPINNVCTFFIIGSFFFFIVGLLRARTKSEGK